MTNTRKALVLLSGGIDSTSCIAYYKEREFAVAALFVDYGQASAQRESTAAKAIADRLQISLQTARVTGLTIPIGEITGRNALLLTVALMALDSGHGLVSLGIHSGTNYGDCSPAFIDASQRLYDMYTGGRAQVDAPFLRWTKGDIYEFALSRGLPVEFTYSCELGQEQPCGSCLSCLDLETLYAR